MIRYTPAKQLTLEGFSTPFSQQLSTTNRWVILAAKIPWNKIRYVGNPLGRSSSNSKEQKRLLQKEMPERNAIEGKFGQGKNAYGLGKIKARLKDTAESWVMSIYFVMNLLKLAAGSLLSVLQVYYWW